jgi:uncharacterized protein (TIGR03067 family)
MVTRPVCAVALAAAVAIPAVFPQSGLPLSGRWRPVLDERDGIVDRDPSSSPWVIDSAGIRVLFLGGSVMWGGRFTVDTSVRPARIDVDVTRAMMDGFRGKALGLYDISRDTLKVCLVFNAADTSSRPSQLTTVRGDKWSCHLLTRVVRTP